MIDLIDRKHLGIVLLCVLAITSGCSSLNPLDSERERNAKIAVNNFQNTNTELELGFVHRNSSSVLLDESLSLDPEEREEFHMYYLSIYSQEFPINILLYQNMWDAFRPQLRF